MFPSDTKHLVVGFGITGLSIVKALSRLGVAHIYAIDSRESPPNEMEIATLCEKVETGTFDSSLLNECDYLWVSPGIAISTPALQQTIKRLPPENVGGDIELFARLVKENIIAITGTNGKSTVTTLVGSMFGSVGYDLYVGGNLGLPALDLWMAYCERDLGDDREPLFILELSSFQLETTYSLKADVGVILNLSPDHLDRYRDYTHYVESKFNLLKQSRDVIIPTNDPLITIALEDSRFAGFSTITRFSLQVDPKSDFYASLEDGLVYAKTGEVISYKGTRLGGTHNILNIVAAVAIAEVFGASLLDIEAGIKSYQPLAHRSVFVREVGGVTYFNDSKATNISSTEAAILGFPQRKWLILGGVTKDQDFSILQALLKNNVAGVALIGVDYSSIVPHIPEDVMVMESKTLDVALKDLQKQAKAGDIILFSPACASFDQFKGFEHRGDVFEALVNALS